MFLWISNIWWQLTTNCFLISIFWLTYFTIVIPIEIIPGQKLLSQIWQSELLIGLTSCWIQKLLTLWMFFGMQPIYNLKT